MNTGAAVKRLGFMVAAMLILGVGCDQKATATSAARSTTTETTARPELWGGDTQAWLNLSGDNPGSSYCATSLKLPLSDKPVWERTYTAAQFSSNPPQELVHYNGRICVAALCPQLMVLDADSGEILANRYIYDGERNIGAIEEISEIQCHPAGYVLARDAYGACYCVDLLSPELPTKWIYAGSPGEFSYSVQGAAVLVSAHGRLRAISIADGTTELWSLPTLNDNAFNVISRDNVTVWWTYANGRSGAVDYKTGTLLWDRLTAGINSLAAIDAWRSRAYFATDIEELECVDLHTGKHLWSFSWHQLISPATRSRAKAKLDALLGDTGITPAPMVVAIQITPDALYFGLHSGDVFKLSPDGKLIWQATLDSMVDFGIAFDNGLLLRQFFTATAQRVQRANTWSFIPDTVDWPTYQQADQQQQRFGQFSRLVVLSLTDGTLCDTFDNPRIALCKPIPARDKIICGLEGDGTDIPASVVAYDWLAPRSK